MNLPTWAANIHHDGSEQYVVLGDGQIGSVVTIRLRAGIDAPIEHILLRTNPDGEQQLTAMQPEPLGDQINRWWRVELQLAAPSTSYRFYIQSANGSWWLTAAGLVRHTPTDQHNFTILANYQGPRWLQNTVFYQIFPDRFADGDPSNNVVGAEYLLDDQPVVVREWGQLPNRATGQYEFFGGDLQGITQKLDYIIELGANALYLNPIFSAPSNHKYDVADYSIIDPHFGGEAALRELREALDQHGMRLMLDIVPNHCGATHTWFQAAQADSTAPEVAFFRFFQHPDEYEAWLGVRSLPKLNYRSELLRERMYAGSEAIMRHWLREPYRADGWRIDVANMLARQGESQLGHKVGRGLRRAIKQESPEAYLLGENFYDGSAHLQGNELDATMNYSGFSLPLLHWLMGIDIVAIQLGRAAGTPIPTEALAAQWRSYMAAIPWQIARQQYNLLGSHDTPRILTTLGGDKMLLRLATTLLFTFPGVPSVYYGDEIGMEGGGDPDCRRCMIWDESAWDHGLRKHYQTLIQLRRVAPALSEGGFQLLHAEGETIAYQRETRSQRLIVVARRAADTLTALAVHHAGLADGSVLRELFSGVESVVQDGMLPVVGLAAPGAQVWII